MTRATTTAKGIVVAATAMMPISIIIDGVYYERRSRNWIPPQNEQKKSAIETKRTDTPGRRKTRPTTINISKKPFTDGEA